MSSIISKLDKYKLDATFGDGTVVHTTRLEGSQCITSPTTTWKRGKKLGAGGFGVVWLDREERSGELRAVKMLARLQLNVREVEAMVELQDVSLRRGRSLGYLTLTRNQHPDLFIVFLGWYEDPHSIFLTMEYIEHGDLAQYIKTNGAKAASEVKEITTQVLRALVVLHSRKICHRDLKPGNILINRQTPIWVKITDFGISKQSLGTSLRTGCGTPSYQAPEMLGLLPHRMRMSRRGSYTQAVDLWALGAIVHEILTSEIPFLEIYEGSDWMATEVEGLTLSAAEPANLPAIVDTELLYAYCSSSEFPTHALENHCASEDAIELVKALMAVNPKHRVSATGALASPYLSRSEPALKRELELLGIEITFEDVDRLVKASRDQIIDIIQSPTINEIRVMLTTAVSMGYLEVLPILLKLPNDIDSFSGPEKLSFLMIAARNNQVPAMRLLLRNGANVQASVKPECRTALHEAAAGGHLDALTFLLDYGANVDMPVTHERGESALHAATAGGHVDAIKLLLDSGADVQWSPTLHGQRALYTAASIGHLRAIEMLVLGGADVNSSGTYGHLKTPIEGAAEAGHVEAIKLLLKIGSKPHRVVITSHCSRIPLHAAAAGGHVEAMRLLIEAGAPIDSTRKGPLSQTALHDAAAGGHLEAIKLLLEYGARINYAAQTPYGQTALYAASAGGHLNAIRLLLDNGANIHQWPQNAVGQTPLQGAAAGGHLAAMVLLLERGAKPNQKATTDQGQTPVYAAIVGSHLDAVKLLLDYGALIDETMISVAKDRAIIAYLKRGTTGAHK